MVDQTLETDNAPAENLATVLREIVAFCADDRNIGYADTGPWPEPAVVLDGLRPLLERAERALNPVIVVEPHSPFAYGDKGRLTEYEHLVSDTPGSPLVCNCVCSQCNDGDDLCTCPDCNVEACGMHGAVTS